MTHLRRILSLAALVGVAACEPATAPEDPFAGLPDGINPVLVSTQRGAEATVELHLRRVNVTDQVAGVQGEIRFDAARLELLGGEFQASSSGMWNPVSAGRVRFAGVATQGFADTPVLTLRFRGSVRDAAQSLGVQVEEITALEGLANRTSLVVPARRPLVQD